MTITQLKQTVTLILNMNIILTHTSLNLKSASGVCYLLSYSRVARDLVSATLEPQYRVLV